jgi:hypothetical protein
LIAFSIQKCFIEDREKEQRKKEQGTRGGKNKGF